MYTCIYVYMYICIYVYVYIYIFINLELNLCEARRMRWMRTSSAKSPWFHQEKMDSSNKNSADLTVAKWGLNQKRGSKTRSLGRCPIKMDVLEMELSTQTIWMMIEISTSEVALEIPEISPQKWEPCTVTITITPPGFQPWKSWQVCWKYHWNSCDFWI